MLPFSNTVADTFGQGELVGIGVTTCLLFAGYLWYRRSTEKARFTYRIAELEDALSNAESVNARLQSKTHRQIKENLQTVISLTNLQQRRLFRGQTSENAEFVDLQERLKAMAVVQRALIDVSSRSTIIGAPMLEEIAKQSLQFSDHNHRVKINAGEIEADRAAPIGLIVRELVDLAAKELPTDRPGSIQINLSRQRDVVLEVIVRGTTRAIESPDASSAFSRSIVQLLCEQISADLSHRRSDSRLLWSVRYGPDSP